MKDVNKNLEQFFHIDSTNETTKQEILKPGATGPASEDYDFARQNLRNLISSGAVSLEGIMKVAIESDNPRAYEVLGQLLKTVSEMNKDLLDLYQKSKAIKKEEIKVNHTTNNSIYVGSTSELQDLINKDRSRNKALDSQKFLDDGV